MAQSLLIKELNDHVLTNLYIFVIMFLEYLYISEMQHYFCNNLIKKSLIVSKINISY